MAGFIADIDPSLPVCFLAFRPNFALENHTGASRSLMNRCVGIARDSGLENAYWSGHTGIAGMVMKLRSEIKKGYLSGGAQLAGSYALYAGCQTHPRGCEACIANQVCRIKRYVPKKVT
ncbi:MAG: hypothetical protein HWN70_12870 [Desulfobacterales bacterium]|nr:hypothetical protein [Desulfobacterales bacterium]